MSVRSMSASLFAALFVLLGLHGAASAQTGRYIAPKSSTASFSGITGQVRTHLLLSAFPHVTAWHSGAAPQRGPALANVPGLYPSDFSKAYGLPNPTNQGAGAVAIVDAYDFSTSLSDFNTFSTTFGLPTEPSTDPTAATNSVFQVIYQGGFRPDDGYYSGWDYEEALDIEWAHAMAPKAKIYLIEAQSNYYSDLLAAVQIAASLPDVRQISMSWGSNEFPSQLDIDANVFSMVTGAVCYAASGDAGAEQSYPAESPYVVGVGGTHLDFDSAGNFSSETAWGDGYQDDYGSGGGLSSYESIPTYQSVIQSIVGTQRGSPDISADADPDSGVAVLCTSEGGWSQVGGTSVSCPVNAGIANARGSANSNATAELNTIYAKYYGSSSVRDIVSGSSGYNATTGWDFATGIGSPVGPVSGGANTLTIQSVSPNSGVSISVSPKDSFNNGNGTSPFSRTYSSSSVVTITAPSTAPNGYVFLYWRIDGTQQALGHTTMALTMNEAHTAAAVYGLTSLTVTSVSLTPSTVYGGQTSVGKVIISGAAGTNGLTVSLSSSNPAIVQVPSTVWIKPTATRVAFTAVSSLNYVSTQVTISATVNGVGKSAVLNLAPSTVGMSVSPTKVPGGGSATLTVTLSPAPTRSVAVSVNADDFAVLNGFPGTVAVGAGKTTGSVTFGANPVAVATLVHFSIPGSVASAKLTIAVTSPALSGFSIISTNPQFGGNYATCLVSLSQPAQSNLVVALRHSVTSLQVPASVTVIKGQQVSTIRFPTLAVAATVSATITATLGTKSRSVVLTMVPAVLISMTLHPTSLVGGTGAQGQAYLEGVAPSTGASVALKSSIPTIAKVPASVLIPSSGRNKTYPITTYKVSKKTVVTITATYRGKSISKTLTISP